jgi:K+-sensing histidine kinase KdpD
LKQWLLERSDGEQRIISHITPDLILNTDVQCIQIIANNLIDNALKHGDSQSNVQVHLTQQMGEGGQPGLELAISSSPGASGWPDAEQLFVKYYRSSGAQRQSGTGLGLFLSHTLSTQLGGTLRYRPAAQTILFELWLPI